MRGLAIFSEAARSVAIPDPQPRRAIEGGSHEPQLPARSRAEEVAISKEGRRRAADRAASGDPQGHEDARQRLIAVRIGPAPPEPLPDPLTKALAEARRLPELHRLAPVKETESEAPPESTLLTAGEGENGQANSDAPPTRQDRELPLPLPGQRTSAHAPHASRAGARAAQALPAHDEDARRAGAERDADPRAAAGGEDAFRVASLAPRLEPLALPRPAAAEAERPRPRTVSLYV